MKTTIDIQDVLLARAKRHAKGTGRPSTCAGFLLSEIIRESRIADMKNAYERE